MTRVGQALSATFVLSFVVLATSAGCGQRYPGKVQKDVDPPNAPCANSEKCKTWGWCGEKDGECAPTADEHCRSSDLCKKSGLCSLVVGEGVDANKCIAKGDDCSNTEWCSKFSLCDASEGVCK